MKTAKDNTLPSVFQYTDYRRFLLDVLPLLRNEGKKLSYRTICNTIGIKSTGHFTLVLQGKANISIPLAMKFAQFLKLKKREVEFFLTLVLFNQAKNHSDKNDYFLKMISFKESAVRLVNADQYAYYDKWYHAVIRALLEIVPVKEDFSEIAKLVDPPVSAEEAKKSIELMVNLRLVEKDGAGNYRPAEAVIDSGPAIGSLAVTNYAINLLDLGKQAFDRFPLQERIFSWSTLGVSEKGYEQVVQELREFRRKVYEIARNDQSANRIYQVNIQAFPVSRRSKGGDTQ
ncbi:MAG: TIGR02147 family protein [Chitinispirillaceae bacterium]|nr:TIGR02147 family protein [Chitinispirillaceae bacterium]